MTKPTGVREIIDGIETKQWWVDDLEQKQCGPWSTVEELRWPDTEKVFHAVEKAAFDKVVAIALELERQRNSHIKCWMSDDQAKHEMNFHNSKLEKIEKLKASLEWYANATEFEISGDETGEPLVDGVPFTTVAKSILKEIEQQGQE